eukprot:g67344.t1
MWFLAINSLLSGHPANAWFPSADLPTLPIQPFEIAGMPLGYPGQSRPFYPTHTSGYRRGRLPSGTFLGNVECDYAPLPDSTACVVPMNDENALVSCMTETTNADCVASAQEVASRIPLEMDFKAPPKMVIWQAATILLQAWGKEGKSTGFLGFNTAAEIYSPHFGASFGILNCSNPSPSTKNDSSCLLCRKANGTCELVFGAMAPPLFGDTEYHYWDMPPNKKNWESFGYTTDNEFSPRKEDNTTYYSKEYEAAKDSKLPLWGMWFSALVFVVPMLAP